MPVKNAGEYLIPCIESILNQDIAQWELIAIDDHSSDDSLTILNQYAGIDHRISVNSLGQEHGIIAALRMAYQCSKGYMITRMDADDMMSKSKLRLMSAALRDKGYGHVAIGAVAYFGVDGIGDGYRRYSEWLNNLTRSASNFDEVYKECVIPSPCWMMYRDDVDAIGGFDHDTYPEDYDLCFRMRGHGIKIAAVQEVVHHWRDHSMRTSRIDEHYKDNRFLELKCQYFKQQDWNVKRPLALWGAGKKGKRIAQMFNLHNMSYTWHTDNERKIGKEIYGHILQSDTSILAIADVQVIVAVSNPKEQQKIIAMLEFQGKRIGRDYYVFC